MTNNKLNHPKAQPHGDMVKVFDNIWFIQGSVKMPMLMPMKISHSMTIIKNSHNDDLSLINSMRLTENGFKQLDKLGNVKNIIRIAGFHGKDDGYYRERYGAKIFAVKGQTYTRKFENTTKSEDGYLQPDVWLDKESELPISNATLKIIESSNPPEGVLLLEKEGGILLTGDSLQNTPKPDQYVNFLAGMMMRKMGFYKEYNIGPGWLGFAKPSADEVRSLLDLNFEHVLPGHGDAVINNAKEKYRPALEGELKGCHTK